MIEENADSGLFITTSYFSEPAREYAEGKYMELIDGKHIDNIHFYGHMPPYL